MKLFALLLCVPSLALAQGRYIDMSEIEKRLNEEAARTSARLAARQAEEDRRTLGEMRTLLTNVPASLPEAAAQFERLFRLQLIDMTPDTRSDRYFAAFRQEGRLYAYQGSIRARMPSSGIPRDLIDLFRESRLMSQSAARPVVTIMMDDPKEVMRRLREAGFPLDLENLALHPAGRNVLKLNADGKTVKLDFRLAGSDAVNLLVDNAPSAPRAREAYRIEKAGIREIP